MGKVSLNQLRERFEAMNQRAQYYEAKSNQQNGNLTRSDLWRYNYVREPYLLGAQDNRLLDYFSDVMHNVFEIGPNGKLRPLSIADNDEFIQSFTHANEEYGARGGMPSGGDMLQARTRRANYFERGEPIGITMFRNYDPPKTPIVVKYGKREHLQQMLENGRIRISNANSYNNENFIDSMRDDETSRTLFIPTFRERLACINYMDISGNRFQFDDDDITIPLYFDDYYLFSLCEHIHYRMPTDFNADAALIVRDPIRFQQLLISAFLARFPDWEPLHGKVVYFDPYRDFPMFNTPEMSKDFRYAYQREVRIAFRPVKKLFEPLQPIFLSIGSMTDYADMVSL